MPATEQAAKYWNLIEERARQWIRPILTPTPAQNVWQWAAEHVDFSLVPNYDTPLHQRYDPEYLPYWKEPAEGTTDPGVSEIIALKSARAGGTENLLLNPIRYSVAVRPQPTLYVTGDQLSAESMMEERVKRGLRASKITRSKLNRASSTQHRIMFADMDFFITWPRAKQAFKQRGYGLVLCDELSVWPEYSADMARKRTASYPFAHIVMISSPDPQQKRASDEDPIFIEYNRGDRRKWNCRDSNGTEFVFELGKRDTAYGLKWDAKAKREDGTWDMDVVRKTAHYVTPSGAVITEADRMDIVRAGRWIATNPDAPANVRSYHITAFMTPFDSLGGIAVAFLKANAAGSSSLRTFVYEYLAEPWVQDTERIYDDQVTRRAAEYMRGQSYLDLHTEYSQLQKARMLTVDVQKDHMWYVCRDWAAGGKSALVEWGFAGTWEDIDAVALRNKVEAVLVDSGYGERTTEVYEECIRRRMVPCKGDDRNTPTELAWRQSQINPFEGTRRTGYSETLALILWRTDIFKQMLLSRIRGDVSGWWVYRGIERDYCQQITAEERTAKGWVKRRRDNHILDCEAMQILAALAYGYLSKYDVPGIDIPPEDPPAE